MNGGKAVRNSYHGQKQGHHVVQSTSSPHNTTNEDGEKLEYTVLEPSCSKSVDQINSVVVEADGPEGIVIRLPAGSNINDFQFIPTSDGSGFPYHIVQVDSHASMSSVPSDPAPSVLYEMPQQESSTSMMCSTEDDMQEDAELGYHQEGSQHFSSPTDNKCHEHMEGHDQEPLYVNARQYDRIMKRREARAKLEREGRIPRERQKYLHKSRHEHALRRVRGEGGKFDAKDPTTPLMLKNNAKEERAAPPIETYIRREVPIMARPGGPRPNGHIHLPQKSIHHIHRSSTFPINGEKHESNGVHVATTSSIGMGHSNADQPSTSYASDSRSPNSRAGSHHVIGYMTGRPPMGNTARNIHAQKVNTPNTRAKHSARPLNR